jgi:AcrR family transcriptional regulator
MSQEHTKRRYNSTRRQIQARETRLRILEASRLLFTTRGYAGATMEGIALEAGVAVETVYAAFGSKRVVLARLVDLAVAGDESPIPLLERPGPQRVRLEPDQRRQIRLFAHDIAQIMERVGPLFGVMRSAAITEPEIATLLQRLLADRRESMAVFVGWVKRNGSLRAELSADEAAASVWTLSSAEVHHLLRVDLGWTVERYEQWLGDSLITLLLPPETPAAK